MPIPSTYTCTKCDFKGSSFSTWGSYFYSINDDLIPINRVLAICYGCDSIVSVERLPSQTDVEALGKNVGSADKKFLEEERRRIEALKKRKSKARCLTCGSHDFEILPVIDIDSRRERLNLPIRTGLIHRNCGGRIYADYRGPNYFMRDSLPEKIFDIEGLAI